MKLKEIDRVETITKDDFLKNYFRPQKPLVIERLIEDWPAFQKWNLDYMSGIAGEKTVPLYDNRPVNYKDGFNEPHTKMKMSSYIELLKKEPTKYRIFLWNILKEVPELQNDFRYPNLGLKIMKGLPMLFFGGKNSYTFMHYDIDLANIFHFQFQGRKEVILFDQDQSDYIYKVPHSIITREDINFEDPNFEKWPALKNANGFKTHLDHGHILYMPEGYWHYMKYVTPGFSMSLRSTPKNPKNLGRALYNILIMRYFDTMMRRLKGQNWINWKNEQALKRAEKFN